MSANKARKEKKEAENTQRDYAEEEWVEKLQMFGEHLSQGDTRRMEHGAGNVSNVCRPIMSGCWEGEMRCCRDPLSAQLYGISDRLCLHNWR